MGLSRTVSETNGDFSRKSQISPTLRVFNAPADGILHGIGIGQGVKKTRMIGLPDGRKSFKIGIVV